MKKRILSVVVIFALVLSMFVMPSIVMAEDYSDYVPEAMPDNLFLNPGSANGIASDNTSGYVKRAYADGYNAYGFTAQKDIVIESAIGAAQRAYYGRLAGTIVKKDGNAFASTQKLIVGNNYVFVLPVKNIGTTDSVTMNIAMSNSANYSTAKYSNEYGADGFTITDKDNYVEFKGTITMPGSTQGAEVSPTVIIGFPDGTPQGAGFAINLANSGVAKMYFAEENLYDMTVANTDEFSDNVTEAGVGMEFKAEAVNQIGSPMDGITFDWYVVDESRTEVCEGFTITPSGDTLTAVVTPDRTLTPGNYVVMAEATNAEAEGFRKGIDIEVTMPVVRDTEPTGEDPINDIVVEVKEGEATLGIFDELILAASVVDTNGAKGENAQQFKWYAMDEGRVNYIDFINIEASEDTCEAEISLPISAEEGEYYIIAESTSEESLGMIQGYKITVDKAGTIDDIIEIVKGDNTSKIEEDLPVYIEILGIEDEYVLKADASDLAILLAGSNSDEVEDSATLSDYIRKNAALSLLNTNPNEVAITDEDGKLIYEDELGLASLDKEDSTIFTLYNEAVSGEGIKEINDVITGKGFESYEEFADTFMQAVVLNSIAYPVELGNGYLADVLTEENLKAIGVDGGNYFELDDPDSFHKEIARSKYTLDELEKLLKDAEDKENEDEEDEDDKPSRGSGSGGGGGGSISIKNDKKDEPNKEEEKQEVPDITVPDFNDVPKTHWAYTDIHFLKSMGVIDGVDSENFAPDAVLTREQFLKLVLDSFELSNASATAPEFTDVSSDKWYAGYVKSGVGMGITNGVSENEFGVGRPITRQDVCVMICRALGIDTADVSLANISFADADEISDYAKSSVAYLSSYAVINGFSDNTFKPADICTRAQAARIICYSLELKEAK